MGRPGFSTRAQRDLASRLHSAAISWIFSRHSRSSAPRSPAMIGAGRAACVVAALWPERVAALVSIGGYNIQNIARSGEPAPTRPRAPAVVPMVFPHRAGAAPGWRRTAGRCAGSYGNCGRRTGISTTPPSSGPRHPSTTPDFVEVVIQSYRPQLRPSHLAIQALDEIEEQLAVQPPITVPTIVLHGPATGFRYPRIRLAMRASLPGPISAAWFPSPGHFPVPQEAPAAVIQAVSELRSRAP